jgi:hypothetical protein
MNKPSSHGAPQNKLLIGQKPSSHGADWSETIPAPTLALDGYLCPMNGF